MEETKIKKLIEEFRKYLIFKDKLYIEDLMFIDYEKRIKIEQAYHFLKQNEKQSFKVHNEIVTIEKINNINTNPIIFDFLINKIYELTEKLEYVNRKLDDSILITEDNTRSINGRMQTIRENAYIQEVRLNNKR